MVAESFKYDIRDWNNDHSRSKQSWITLTLEEFKKFKRFTNNWIGW
nr:hypothetical protein [Mycoplasmopsis bovis]